MSGQSKEIDSRSIFVHCRRLKENAPAALTLMSGSLNDGESVRNQLDDLKKKIRPIQQMIISLQPKKKYALIEYIPDFEAYDQIVNPSPDDDELHTASLGDALDSDNPDSLSERLYKEIDGQTTRTL
jgi:hypothetical protein